MHAGSSLRSLGQDHIENRQSAVALSAKKKLVSENKPFLVRHSVFVVALYLARGLPSWCIFFAYLQVQRSTC